VEIRLHDDPAGFAALARPLLHADPVRHTLALTCLERVLCEGERAPSLVSVHDGGAPVGVALRCPGRPLRRPGLHPTGPPGPRVRRAVTAAASAWALGAGGASSCCSPTSPTP
jgi:hypothetical protein